MNDYSHLDKFSNERTLQNLFTKSLAHAPWPIMVLNSTEMMRMTLFYKYICPMTVLSSTEKPTYLQKTCNKKHVMKAHASRGQFFWRMPNGSTPIFTLFLRRMPNGSTPKHTHTKQAPLHGPQEGSGRWAIGCLHLSGEIKRN